MSPLLNNLCVTAGQHCGVPREHRAALFFKKRSVRYVAEVGGPLEKKEEKVSSMLTSLPTFPTSLQMQILYSITSDIRRVAAAAAESSVLFLYWRGELSVRVCARVRVCVTPLLMLSTHRARQER